MISSVQSFHLSPKQDFNPEDSLFGKLILAYKSALPPDKAKHARSIQDYAKRVYPNLNLYAILQIHKSGLLIPEIRTLKEHLASSPVSEARPQLLGKIVKFEPRRPAAKA